MSTTTRQASRDNVTTDHPHEIDHVNCGSLQRIADATEKMARNYTELQNRCDYYKLNFHSTLDALKKRDRTIAALRGQITKLKKSRP